MFPVVMVSKSTEMAQAFKNQQRWLLFLLHARTCCKQPGEVCSDRNCVTVQRLWSHMNSCVETQCVYPLCHPTKALITHYKNCKDLRCPVCVPVKTYLEQQANMRAQACLETESSQVNKALVSNDSVSPHCPDSLDLEKLRESMQTLVFNMLQQQHQPYPGDDALKAKHMEVARRLEEGLLKMALSKGDYLNQSTLESRVTSLIRGKKSNNCDQNQQNAISSPLGTMMSVEIGDQLETEIADFLKSMSLYR
ncbi:unnamed protein product [Microthlaspi erraticum]|uniref:histone acetyltransferase n=1 Tax=Microthlaspi erraticum TaxID=1685480 RepID=A0A6D2KTP3_9BRAS|nr:unnamed protein product [Microthlaspi erraticum]